MTKNLSREVAGSKPAIAIYAVHLSFLIFFDVCCAFERMEGWMGELFCLCSVFWGCLLRVVMNYNVNGNRRVRPVGVD